MTEVSGDLKAALKISAGITPIFTRSERKLFDQLKVFRIFFSIVESNITYHTSARIYTMEIITEFMF